ncbi:hypothetical protein, partial [Agrobacterium sp. 224MFTsu3.1]
KRDRQSLFTRVQISPDPASFAAHVSLSSHIQLSKNRPHQTVTKSNPKSIKPLETNKHSAHHPDFFRTKVVVASSAAALVQ